MFLDGDLLYTTEPGITDLASAVFPEEYSPIQGMAERVRVTLPTGWGGRGLILAAQRVYNAYGGTPMIYLSSVAAEAEAYMATANSIGMPAAAFMTGAFLLLALFLYSGIQGRWNWPMLLLTLSAGLQSFYHLREYSIHFSVDNALNIPAAALIPTLFVALPLGYLCCQMRRGTALRAVLLLLPAAVSLLPGACYLFGAALPIGLENFCSNALHLSLVGLLVFAALEMRSGNDLFRLFFGGLGIAAAALGITAVFSEALRNYLGYLALEIAHRMPADFFFWCGTLLFVLCAAMSVAGLIGRMAEERAEAEVRSVQLAAMNSRVSAVQAAEETVRIERHDLRHALSALEVLLDRKDLDGALDYVRSLLSREQPGHLERWCRYPILDAVFSSYFAQAKQQDIRVQAELAFPNALPVEISNPCAAPILLDGEGFPVSSGEGHGFGLRSIRSFCQKNNASIFCSYQDGWFSLRIVF